MSSTGIKNRRHQLVDRLLPLGVPLQGLQRRPAHDRDVVAGELVGRQQLPHLQLDEV
jgi:hypothetical protein